MADPTDLKGSHMREFTDHELLTLRVWFDLDQAGNDTLAEAFLDAGLSLEHYTSLLDNDASKRTQTEIANQQQLAFAFQRLLNQAEAFLNTVPRNRPTALTRARIERFNGNVRMPDAVLPE